MKDHGRIKSTVNPERIVIDEFSVWINTNIKQVKEVSEENIEAKLYEYNCIQYGKDEYIKLMNEQLTDTQIALTELYEGLVI